MKIAYLLSDTNRFAGATKSLLTLVNNLVTTKGSVELVFICPNKSGCFEDLGKIGHTIYIPYRFASIPKTSTLKDKILCIPKYIARICLNKFAIIRLRSILINQNIDLIHSNTSVTNVGQAVADHLNIPHITHIREYGDKDFNLKIPGIKKRLMNKNNYNISITSDIARHRDVLGTNFTRVIYNGISKSEDVNLNPSKKPFFLYAGRIEPTKGLQDLLIAFKNLLQANPDRNIRLKIAGDAVSPPQKDFKNKLEGYISENNIADRIDWLGMCDNMAEIYSEALATIIPSFNEGFGRVMAEAIFNGSLVIGRNTSGTKEQFENGKKTTGEDIGLKFNSIEDLTKAMESVITNGIEFYFPLIDKAQITAKKLYSTESCVESVYTFYKDILNKKINHD